MATTTITTSKTTLQARGTSEPLPVLPLAVVQPVMKATIAENLPGLLAEIIAAAREGARLVLLPECATTGFHRGLPGQCRGHSLTDAAGVLRRASDQLGVAVVVGSPWPHDGGILNAAVVLRPGCVPLVAPKVGLTDSERQFFTVAPRGEPWTFGGWRLATVLCREVEDLEALAEAYAGRVDALLWPGYVAWDGEGPDGGGLEVAASRLAARLGVPILQCNWPDALNVPGQHLMGRSQWIGADGQLRAEGPSGAGRVLWRLGGPPLSLPGT